MDNFDFDAADSLFAEWVDAWSVAWDGPGPRWPDVEKLTGPVVFAVPAGESVPPVEEWVDDPSLRTDVC